jgi:hypothetical protein
MYHTQKLPVNTTSADSSSTVSTTSTSKRTRSYANNRTSITIVEERQKQRGQSRVTLRKLRKCSTPN